MENFKGSVDGSESVTSYFGKDIDSSFACEPAAKYGQECEEDIYQVDFIAPDMPKQHLTFMSLDQLLEFNMQFNRFVASIVLHPENH